MRRNWKALERLRVARWNRWSEVEQEEVREKVREERREAMREEERKILMKLSL
jgi:hypothetical protein